MTDREKKRAYDKAQYPLIRERKIATAKAHYEANRERKKQMALTRYYAKREEILAQQAESRRKKIAEDPAYTKAEYQAHVQRKAAKPVQYAEARRIADKRRRAADPEKFREALRKRYWEDPEQSRADGVMYAQNRRARKLKAGGVITALDVRTLRERQKDKCAFCLKPFGKATPHVDHYIPLARGGTNNVKNIRLLHRQCNMSKHAKHPLDFAIHNGMLCW